MLQDTEVFIGEQELVALCFIDSDGDAVTVTATVSDRSVVDAVVQAGGQSVLLTGKDVGEAVITLVAQDSNGLSSGPQAFTVTVPNRAPEATKALPDIALSYGAPDASLPLTEYFTDPDGHPLAFSAAVGDETVIRVAVTEDTLKVEPLGSGSALVTVTATDPHGLQGQRSFQVMITNRAPVLTQAPKALLIPLGDSLSLILDDYFEDPDGNELAYSAASSNASAVTVSVAGDTMTVNAVGRGAVSINITATDGDKKTLVTVNAVSFDEREIVFEDDFDADDGSWQDASVFGGEWEIKDGKLRLWSPTAEAITGVTPSPLQAVDWVVEASVRGAKDSGVSIFVGWPNSEAGYFAVSFEIGDLAPRGRYPRSHYRIVVVKDSETAIAEYGTLEDYDYLEYTTVSAGLENGELVLNVSDTEVARFESQYVNVVMDDLALFHSRPIGKTGSDVFVDWVRVWGIVSR